MCGRLPLRSGVVPFHPVLKLLIFARHPRIPPLVKQKKDGRLPKIIAIIVPEKRETKTRDKIFVEEHDWDEPIGESINGRSNP